MTISFCNRRDLGIIVGLKAEAESLRTFFPNAHIVISGATSRGARDKSCELSQNQSINYLLSCGLAAGLAPTLEPGTITIPQSVKAWGKSFTTDDELSSFLKGDNKNIVSDSLLHSDEIISSSLEKLRLFEKTHCSSLDMESGYLAHYASIHKKPFAILRVICDPSWRSLPHAAKLIMETNGRIDIKSMFISLCQEPRQVPYLIQLGVDAFKARHNMNKHLKNIAK